MYVHVRACARAGKSVSSHVPNQNFQLVHDDEGSRGVAVLSGKDCGIEWQGPCGVLREPWLEMAVSYSNSSKYRTNMKSSLSIGSW